MTSINPSEPNLPDDVKQWPSDERALFGLAQDASRRDLKRAYTRLIRRFKPEHSPEQFRRLREAFEQLDLQFEYRDRWQEYAVETPDSEPSSDAAPATIVEDEKPIVHQNGPSDHEQQTEDASNDHQIRIGRHHDSVDAIEQLWQDAVQGSDVSETYARMINLVQRRPPSETEYARLYWLLTLHPKLDSYRDPTSWLIEGIKAHGCGYDLFTLLSIDVRRRFGIVPAVLELDPTVFDDSHYSISRYLELRWFVARRQRRFLTIRDDLSKFSRVFLFHQDEWNRLLTVALRNVVLTTDNSAVEALKSITAEFDDTAYTNEARNLSVLYDNTLAVHECWNHRGRILTDTELGKINVSLQDGKADVCLNPHVKETRQTLADLFDLIHRTWECSTTEFAADLISFCDRLVHQSPNTWLELAAATQVAKPLVRRLLEMIREQLSESVVDDSFYVTDATTLKLDRFVRRGLWRESFWQPKVFEFCCKEAVQPYNIAEAIERNHEDLPDFCLPLAQSIRQDLTITCLVEANRLFW